MIQMNLKFNASPAAPSQGTTDTAPARDPSQELVLPGDTQSRRGRLYPICKRRPYAGRPPRLRLSPARRLIFLGTPPSRGAASTRRLSQHPGPPAGSPAAGCPGPNRGGSCGARPAAGCRRAEPATADKKAGKGTGRRGTGRGTERGLAFPGRLGAHQWVRVGCRCQDLPPDPPFQPPPLCPASVEFSDEKLPAP